jgi:hypothetical protein
MEQVLFGSLWILFILVIYIAGILFAPFPYWRTYLLLWRHVLITPGKFGMKRRQAFWLARSGLSTPLWTLLWYLDEILFPAYRQGKFDPVFIIGQPRCGTTLLHRTLAADGSNFFAIRHIEWRYPFISLQRLFAWLGIEQRLNQVNYWSKTEAGKLAAKMHPNTLADWEEDGIFFEENFLHHFFIFLRFPQPELLGYLDDFPSLPAPVREKMLRAHEKVIKKVQFLRGGQPCIYLSKEVTSHNKIPYLLSLYPKASFIVIVRQSSDFMASLMALVRASTASKTGIDPISLEGWVPAFVERMAQDSQLLVDLCEQHIASERQARIASAEFTQDIERGVLYIYQQLGLRADEGFMVHLHSLNEQQAKRQRGYQYSSVQTGRSEFEGYDRFVHLVSDAYHQAMQKSGPGRQV